jgi:hypothetical protein
MDRRLVEQVRDSDRLQILKVRALRAQSLMRGRVFAFRGALSADDNGIRFGCRRESPYHHDSVK